MMEKYIYALYSIVKHVYENIDVRNHRDEKSVAQTRCETFYLYLYEDI